MAFPTTSVLDSFTRADGSPGANWGGKLFSGDSGGCSIASNALQCTASQSDYWSPSTFGPDTEVFATLPNIGSLGGIAAVFARITNPGTGTFCAYEAYAVQASSIVQVYRIDNGTYVQLDANGGAGGLDISQAIGNDDGLGLQIVGSLITVQYRVGAGAWNPIGTPITDSTYSSAGYIGVESDSAGMKFDEFGGGTIGGAPDPSFQPQTLRPAIFSPGLAR